MNREVFELYRLAAMAAAASEAPVPLILEGITGAISEWDGELSAKTGGSPVTQWNDLITTNHFTEDHTSGSGAVLTTINGRGALDFTPAQHYDGGAITMPAPSTGFTICSVVRPHSVAANRIYIGAQGISAGSGGFSLWVQTAPAYRAALSDGVSIAIRGGPTGLAAANTTAIVQGGYDSGVVKIKVNGETPSTTAHALTSLGGATAFGLGSISNSASATNAFDGDILWAGVCTGLLSNADMATIADRLNSRFTVF